MRHFVWLSLVLLTACLGPEMSTKTALTPGSSLSPTSPTSSPAPTPTPSLGGFNYFLYMGVTTGTNVYKVDPNTGLLGAPTAQNLCGGFLPDVPHMRAYVICGSDSTIKTYSINPTTGLFTLTHSLSITNAGDSFTIDTNGKFFVSMDGSGNLNYFSIDVATGIVTVQGGPVATGAFCNYPVNLAIDSTGKYAYQSCYNSADISIYSLDATTGLPTHLSNQLVASGGAAYVGASPTQNFIFVADQNNSAIDSYSIAPTTGLLTLVTNLSIGTVSPDWGSIDDTGRFFYTSNQAGSPADSEVLVHNDGSLSAVNPGVSDTWDGNVTSDGFNVTSFAGLPYAYVGNGANISFLNLNTTTGALSLSQSISSGGGASYSQGLKLPKS